MYPTRLGCTGSFVVFNPRSWLRWADPATGSYDPVLVSSTQDDLHTHRALILLLHMVGFVDGVHLEDLVYLKLSWKILST